AGTVQVLGQPLSTIHPHMDGERKPGLQAHIDQTDIRVVEVMVVVQTLTGFATQFEFLLFALGSDFVRPATLHTLEDADQPLLDAVPLGDFPSPGFLIHVTVVQVLHGTPLADGHVLSCLAYLSGDVAGKRLEILEQHLSLPQVPEHSTNISEKPPCAAKANAIKAMKETRDTLAETLYKSLHNVALPVARVVLSTSLY